MSARTSSVFYVSYPFLQAAVTVYIYVNAVSLYTMR